MRKKENEKEREMDRQMSKIIVTDKKDEEEKMLFGVCFSLPTKCFHFICYIFTRTGFV
jgi:hypothetical protein